MIEQAMRETFSIPSSERSVSPFLLFSFVGTAALYLAGQWHKGFCGARGSSGSRTAGFSQRTGRQKLEYVRTPAFAANAAAMRQHLTHALPCFDNDL
jgi:hypothetical protein